MTVLSYLLIIAGAVFVAMNQYLVGVLLLLAGLVALIINALPKTHRPSKRKVGFSNKYSMTLIVIMLSCIGYGSYLATQLNPWGLAPMIFGLLMVKGIKGPKSTPESPSRKVWLLTFLGRHTKVKVDQLTMVLDWIPGLDIVGYLEADMKKEDDNIKLQEQVMCADNAYVQGFVSVAVAPDDEDDDPTDPDIPNPKTGAEKLQDFFNIGGIKGVKAMIDDILTLRVKDIAKEPEHTSHWMERNCGEITETIFDLVRGRIRSMLALKTSRHLADTDSLGTTFYKFQVIVAASDKVKEERDKTLIEIAQRRYQAINNETMNIMITKRIKLFKKQGKKLDPEKAQAMIFKENALDQDKLRIIDNSGGLNVADANKMFDRGGGKK